MSLALRVVASALLRRATSHRYGEHPRQVADLHRPPGAGPHPVAVVLHGGYWQPPWTKLIMRPLCLDLARRGWAAWNVEYRRLGRDGGGWPQTFDDVAAAIDHLAELGLAGGRVVAIGHSAGGHLAAWAASRQDARVPLTGYVSQAGVLDTKRAYELGLSDGVAEHFLAASPIERLPAVPGLLVHGTRDDIVPLEISEAYAAASGAELAVFDEGHFGHLKPDNPMWTAVVEWLARRDEA